MLKREAATKTVVINDGPMSVDSISLQSLGAYMLFRSVNEESAEDLCEFIIKSNFMLPPTQPLTIMINSPGGSVYDGFGIIDLMECSRLKISTVAIGVVASMAAVIFTAGTKGMRTMSKNAFIMTHQFHAWMDGKYHELIAMREHEDDLQRRMVQHFVRNSKMTEKQIKDVILGPSDKWISAEEALKLGLCDKIQNPWT
jgi:ATP-dependent Clp protease protease subunit